jgi:hypothetical protein
LLVGGTIDCGGGWHVALVGIDERQVFGVPRVSGMRATTNGGHEHAFRSGQPDLCALGAVSPSRGDVRRVPHVAYHGAC